MEYSVLFRKVIAEKDVGTAQSNMECLIHVPINEHFTVFIHSFLIFMELYGIYIHSLNTLESTVLDTDYFKE